MCLLCDCNVIKLNDYRPVVCDVCTDVVRLKDSETVLLVASAEDGTIDPIQVCGPCFEMIKDMDEFMLLPHVPEKSDGRKAKGKKVS